MKKRNSRKLIKAVLLPFAAMVLLTGCSTSSSNPAMVSAELTKMNVIYMGVDNPVFIVSSNHNPGELEVSINNGSIVGADGEYMIRPTEEGKAILTISAEGDSLDTKILRALSLPDPSAGIMIKVDDQTKFIAGGYISLKNLVETDKIHADLSDFLFEVEFNIVSFQLNVIGTSGINIIEDSDSNHVTDRQKELLRRMHPGQRVFIEDIYAIGPDGLERQLNNLTFKIIE
jgi:gliding motility-associated protein GldM